MTRASNAPAAEARPTEDKLAFASPVAPAVECELTGGFAEPAIGGAFATDGSVMEGEPAAGTVECESNEAGAIREDAGEVSSAAVFAPDSTSTEPVAFEMDSTAWDLR
jgi:hypothetical protein